MTHDDTTNSHLNAADLVAADLALAARRAITVPEVSDDFMTRLMADVVAAQPRGAAAAIVRDAAPGGWRGLFSAIGGWPAFGSLVAATVTGLWVGIAPPDAVSTFAANMLGDTVALDLSSAVADYGLEV